mmetsp:Transcript_836/g.2304  ORF Transcript_836/g.2304 Transcript_836/m.2304 type:complete len:312 (+) Transcript_836:3647-4582(+)
MVVVRANSLPLGIGATSLARASGSTSKAWESGRTTNRFCSTWSRRTTMEVTTGSSMLLTPMPWRGERSRPAALPPESTPPRSALSTSVTRDSCDSAATGAYLGSRGATVNPAASTSTRTGVESDHQRPFCLRMATWLVDWYRTMYVPSGSLRHVLSSTISRGAVKRPKTPLPVHLCPMMCVWSSTTLSVLAPAKMASPSVFLTLTRCDVTSDGGARTTADTISAPPPPFSSSSSTYTEMPLMCSSDAHERFVCDPSPSMEADPCSTSTPSTPSMRSNPLSDAPRWNVASDEEPTPGRFDTPRALGGMAARI